MDNSENKVSPQQTEQDTSQSTFQSESTSQSPLRSTFAPTIVLIGFMASGKSSVAQALAELRRCTAVDIDTLIERAAQKRISEIFADSGEEAFRQLETAQLRAALEDSCFGVIATGGGIVTREENRMLLRAAPKKTVVVYLRASNETLADRIRRQPGLRPLIDGQKVLDLHQTQLRVQELLEQRAPLYEEAANFTIQTDGLTPLEVAEAILQKAEPAIV